MEHFKTIKNDTGFSLLGNQNQTIDLEQKKVKNMYCGVCKLCTWKLSVQGSEFDSLFSILPCVAIPTIIVKRILLGVKR